MNGLRKWYRMLSMVATLEASRSWRLSYLVARVVWLGEREPSPVDVPGG
jgi:hypothetical protein